MTWAVGLPHPLLWGVLAATLCVLHPSAFTPPPRKLLQSASDVLHGRFPQAPAYCNSTLEPPVFVPRLAPTCPTSQS